MVTKTYLKPTYLPTYRLSPSSGLTSPLSHYRASEQKTKQAGKPPPNRRQYSPNSERVNKSSGLIEETAS